MDQINKIIPQHLEGSTPTKPQKKNTDKITGFIDRQFEEMMIRLWEMLHELYGRKAERELGYVGESVFISWKNNLCKFKTDRLKVILPRALDQVARDKSEWPPTLQKMLRICFEVEQEIIGKAARKEFAGYLPIIMDKSENGKGKTALREMKAIIRGTAVCL